MNLLALLRSRFAAGLESLLAEQGDLAAPDKSAARQVLVAELAEMVRQGQDPKFGDYQANCAMPLAKRLGKPPREVAQDLLARVDLSDLCAPPAIAGPGFINLRLRDDWLARQVGAAAADARRLGVAPVPQPRTFVIDYSAPNVAKPMHVGHIRSTVIGDSLYRLLKFLGHTTISDNHIGDWGTQFGMIIFGYKHFLDSQAYEERPVQELARLYRLVNRLVDYHEGQIQAPKLAQEVQRQEQALAALREQTAKLAPAEQKKGAKDLRRAETRLAELAEELAALRQKLAAAEADPDFLALARANPNIGQAVLGETAKLHAGDEENARLWREFLPPCMADIEKTYKRLGVSFDYTLGESFYHDRLAAVVQDLQARGIARLSEGAVCVFLENSPAPMLIRKQDGAFLYATTDLATIQYRVEKFRPQAVLYVVDHRQSLHFEQLFAAARRWGYQQLELRHISFGSVLGEDGRPFKTRAGDTVGLESLLDEAVSRAYQVVSQNDDQKPAGPDLSDEERRRIAEAVGIGALKYADLAQNRTSDYVFSYEKMLAMNGNTATYMQYAYARVRSIIAKGNVSAADLGAWRQGLQLAHPAERALGLELLRFSEALADAADLFEHHRLCAYLFALAGRLSSFYEQCPVLQADTEEARHQRLVLCDLTARTIRLGLSLLGINVAEQM